MLITYDESPLAKHTLGKGLWLGAGVTRLLQLSPLICGEKSRRQHFTKKALIKWYLLIPTLIRVPPPGRTVANTHWDAPELQEPDTYGLQ